MGFRLFGRSLSSLRPKGSFYKDHLYTHWNQIVEQASDRYGSMIDRLQFPNDYNREKLLRDYIQEIWLSELKPPTTANTGPLITCVVEGKEDEFIQLLKKMHPNVIDPSRWWCEVENLYNAVCFVLHKEHESLPLTEDFIKKVKLISNVVALLIQGRYTTK